jgi:hypothetical protein
MDSRRGAEPQKKNVNWNYGDDLPGALRAPSSTGDGLPALK